MRPLWFLLLLSFTIASAAYSNASQNPDVPNQTHQQDPGLPVHQGNHVVEEKPPGMIQTGVGYADSVYQYLQSFWKAHGSDIKYGIKSSFRFGRQLVVVGFGLANSLVVNIYQALKPSVYWNSNKLYAIGKWGEQAVFVSAKEMVDHTKSGSISSVKVEPVPGHEDVYVSRFAGDRFETYYVPSKEILLQNALVPVHENGNNPYDLRIIIKDEVSGHILAVNAQQFGVKLPFVMAGKGLNHEDILFQIPRDPIMQQIPLSALPESVRNPQFISSPPNSNVLNQEISKYQSIPTANKIPDNKRPRINQNFRQRPPGRRFINQEFNQPVGENMPFANQRFNQPVAENIQFANQGFNQPVSENMPFSNQRFNWQPQRNVSRTPQRPNQQASGDVPPRSPAFGRQPNRDIPLPKTQRFNQPPNKGMPSPTTRGFTQGKKMPSTPSNKSPPHQQFHSPPSPNYYSQQSTFGEGPLTNDKPAYNNNNADNNWSNIDDVD